MSSERSPEEIAKEKYNREDNIFKAGYSQGYSDALKARAERVFSDVEIGAWLVADAKRDGFQFNHSNDWVESAYHAGFHKAAELRATDPRALVAAVEAAWPLEGDVINASCEKYAAAVRQSGEAYADGLARLVLARIAFEEGTKWLKAELLKRLGEGK